ncbi:MAG: hypothetical protein IIW48_06835, partial [Clostridia bacterium]|nr:hypothetical protein [Clostridia bacterium]
DKYARIYRDFIMLTNNAGGSVFIDYSNKHDINEDKYAFSPHTRMLYFRVHLECGAPHEIRAHYEGRYDWPCPYDESSWKKACLKSFETYTSIDKTILWHCILDEIIDNKCEEWDSYGEWYFYYPIVCPEDFRGDKREKFKKAIEERLAKLPPQKPNATAAEKAVKVDAANSIENRKQTPIAPKIKNAFINDIQLPANREFVIGVNDDCDKKGGYAYRHVKFKKIGADWCVSNVALECRKSEKVTTKVNGKEIGESFTVLNECDKITLVGVFNEENYIFTIK